MILVSERLVTEPALKWSVASVNPPENVRMVQTSDFVVEIIRMLNEQSSI